MFNFSCFAAHSTAPLAVWTGLVEILSGATGMRASPYVPLQSRMPLSTHSIIIYLWRIRVNSWRTKTLLWLRWNSCFKVVIICVLIVLKTMAFMIILVDAIFSYSKFSHPRSSPRSLSNCRNQGFRRQNMQLKLPYSQSPTTILESSSAMVSCFLIQVIQAYRKTHILHILLGLVERLF